MAVTKEEAVANFKATNPGKDLFVLTSGDIEIVTRKPDKFVYRELLQVSVDPKIILVDVYEKVLHACLVWPAALQFDAMTNDDPTLIGDFGNQLSALLFKKEEAAKKKL